MGKIAGNPHFFHIFYGKLYGFPVDFPFHPLTLQIYEMASDLCELQASQPDLLPQYIEQVLRKISVATTCDGWCYVFVQYHAVVTCVFFTCC